MTSYLPPSDDVSKVFMAFERFCPVVIRLQIKEETEEGTMFPPPQPIWFQKTPAWIGFRLHTRFHALFNDMPHIYLCECNSKIFMAKTYSSQPWLWPEYVKSRFAFASTVKIKGLCLQLKRSGTEHAAQKINFLTSTVANGRPLPLWKVSLDSD